MFNAVAKTKSDTGLREYTPAAPAAGWPLPIAPQFAEVLGRRPARLSTPLLSATARVRGVAGRDGPDENKSSMGNLDGIFLNRLVADGPLVPAPEAADLSRPRL
jgi:hypothetical protein